MCGIIGYIGKQCNIHILNGLKELQNRGYDSCGISTLKNNKIKTTKFASTINETSITKLEHTIDNHEEALCGIGHTRWATHGIKSDNNSHPHMSYNNNFVLVHNGIIENYLSIKNELLSKNIKFQSETDSEVIVNLIEYEYSKINNNTNDTNIIKKILEKISKILKGSWAITLICRHIDNTIFSTCYNKPLLVSINKNNIIISSEYSGFCNDNSIYYICENNIINIISKNIHNKYYFNNKNIYKKYSNKNIPNLLDTSIETLGNNYKYYIEKEINEQVITSKNIVSEYIKNNDIIDLFNNDKDILNCDNIILLGCGTSYYAACIGADYFKQYCDFNYVLSINGSEFNSNDIPKKDNTIVIILSQSGETGDLINCIKICKQHNLKIISITNVENSMISRNSNYPLYLNIGIEKSVASTKSFTSQILVLFTIILWFNKSHDKRIIIDKKNNDKQTMIINNLNILSHNIHTTIKNTYNNINKIINLFNTINNCFILGKGVSEFIAYEGALKIKEISYIHAEGYSSSSLKHGPFALLDNKFVVIIIILKNEYYSKNINCYNEIKSRINNIIIITDILDITKYISINTDYIMYIDRNDIFNDVLCIIPLQILAYKLSLSKNINPDMPRNLAKVVTVE